MRELYLYYYWFTNLFHNTDIPIDGSKSRGSFTPVILLKIKAPRIFIPRTSILKIIA